jgi:hypothetical protein
MKIVRLFLASIFGVTLVAAHAQCPVSVADLVAGTANGVPVGGTYNCTGPTFLVASGTVSFTNPINYSGGNLTITGVSTATTTANFTWNNGTLSIDGNLRVAAESLTIQSGTILLDDGRFSILAGASATIQSTATLTTTVDHGDNTIAGTAGSPGILTINGTANFAGDLVITGSTANVIMNTNATVNISRTPQADGDLEVTNGGTFTMNGGTLSIQDDITTEIDGAVGAPSTGNFLINGTVTVGDDIIMRTGSSLTSSAVGSGTINIGNFDGSTNVFSDPNCPYTSGVTVGFCHCTGADVHDIMCSSALPIELLNFSAIQKDNIVELLWETATETNNHFFTLERLLDNDSFESLLTVEGNGTTMIARSYTAIDANPHEGKNYYRLKQTDYDGKNTTSEVIMAEFERTEISYSVYPNPTRDNKFEIQVNGLRPEQEVSMSLRTLQGARVFDFQHKASVSGSVHQQVEVPAKGFYLLDVAGKPIKIIVE